MNTLLTVVLSWMWGVMAPMVPVEVQSGPTAAAQPPPTCPATANATAGAEACKSGGGAMDRVTPRKGDTIYNGI